MELYSGGGARGDNMRKSFDEAGRLLCLGILSCLLLDGFAGVGTARESQPSHESELRQQPQDKSELNLKAIPFKIIYETYRETEGRENWELYLINADGSNGINLTQTKDVDEMYPHVSPDGTKVCFVVDEVVGRQKVRNVYGMNIDGTGRVKVADNARQPCWSPDGKTIAYLKSPLSRMGPECRTWANTASQAAGRTSVLTAGG